MVCIVVIGSLWVTASYVLAAFNLPTNEMTTAAVVTSIIGTYVSYVIASFKEKDSRNKYGIDEQGNRIHKNDDDNLMG